MLNILKTHFNSLVVGLHFILICTFEEYEKRKFEFKYLSKYYMEGTVPFFF